MLPGSVRQSLRSTSLLLILLAGCRDSATEHAHRQLPDAPIAKAATEDSADQPPVAAGHDHLAGQHWDRVYNQRHQLYEQHFGPLPDDILKMVNLFGVWPGGGLFEFQAQRLDDLWVYASFGLTNPDMPTTVTVQDGQLQIDEQGRRYSSTGRLVKKSSTVAAREAGYGYELIVLSHEKSDWALGLLQWAVNAELVHEAGLLNRVEEYSGLTVQDVHVDDEQPLHILIAPAQPPLPATLDLPNGPLKLLVITTITSAEMQYSFDHGRDKLLELLMQSSVGQRSDRKRASVVPSSG